MTVHVHQLSKDSFEVTVQDPDGESRHQVTCSDVLLRVLAPTAASKEAAIRAAFAFLLAREPRQSILPRFDISYIGRFFPEFREKLSDYLKP